MSDYFKGFTDEQRELAISDKESLAKNLEEIVEKLKNAKSDDEIVQSINSVVFYGNIAQGYLNDYNVKVI